MVRAGPIAAKSLVLTVLALAAGGALWLARTSAFGSIDPEPSSQIHAADLSLKTEPAATPPSREAIVARPLFSPERRPALSNAVAPQPPIEPVADKVSEPPAPPPSYVVSGIVVSATLRKVLLRNNVGEKGLWVSEGAETREGWRVLTISSDTIKMLKHSQQISLDVRGRSGR